MTVFYRAVDLADKAAVLRGRAAGSRRRFDIPVSDFAGIPGSTFAYWVGDEIRSLFQKHPPFENDWRYARAGLQTSDNTRFARTWWELPFSARRSDWKSLVLGGGVSPFYYRLDLAVDWSRDGEEIKAFAETTPGTSHWSRNVRNSDLYLRPGLTWGLRTKRFQPSCVPDDCVFTVSRYQAFVEGGSRSTLLAHVGLMSGSIVTTLLRMCSERFEHPKYVVGIVQTVPVPDLAPESSDVLGSLARRGWSLLRSLDTVVGVSHAFAVPEVLQVGGGPFGERVKLWGERVAAVEADLAGVQDEIDDVCFDLYGISDEDRRAITDGFGISSDSDESDDGSAGSDSDGSDDAGSEGFSVELDPVGLGAGLVSWCVGVV